MENEIQTQVANADQNAVTVNRNSKFDVSAISYFFTRIGWVLLNIITLGIASLGNEIREMKYLAAHAVIDGYHIKFNGRKRQLRRKYKWWNVKTVLTLGLYKYYKDINFEKWKVKHTKFVDPLNREGSSYFDGKTGEWMATYFKCWALRWLTLGLMSPLASYYKCQYFINNTYVNGKRLQYDRTKEDVLKQMKKDILYSILTLGIYGIIMIPYNTLKNDLAHIGLEKNAFDTILDSEVDKDSLYSLKSVRHEELMKVWEVGGNCGIAATVIFIVYFAILPMFSLPSVAQNIFISIFYVGCFCAIFFGVTMIIAPLLYYAAYVYVKNHADDNVDTASNVATDTQAVIMNRELFQPIKDKLHNKQKLNQREAIIYFVKIANGINSLVIFVGLVCTMAMLYGLNQNEVLNQHIHSFIGME